MKNFNIVLLFVWIIITVSVLLIGPSKFFLSSIIVVGRTASLFSFYVPIMIIVTLAIAWLAIPLMVLKKMDTSKDH